MEGFAPFLTWTYAGSAALCASIANLLIRKTIDKGGKTEGYLSVYFLLSFFIALLISHPFKATAELGMSCSLRIAGIAACVGIMVFLLMRFTAAALNKGPTGLTFAFQNSGAVFPALILALLFDETFGFKITMPNVLGILLVLAGLFWSAGAAGKDEKQRSAGWLKFAIAAFCSQALILSTFQWKWLLFKPELPYHALIPFHCDLLEDSWFMPALFGASFICQALYFGLKQKRLPTVIETVGGSLGGILNGLSTVFLLKATEVATTGENAMLFPVFSVLVILICHLYGKFLYKEKVHWVANGVCTLGILIGTIC